MLFFNHNLLIFSNLQNVIYLDFAILKKKSIIYIKNVLILI